MVSCLVRPIKATDIIKEKISSYELLFNLSEQKFIIGVRDKHKYIIVVTKLKIRGNLAL
jgi:hypothetical protein